MALHAKFKLQLPRKKIMRLKLWLLLKKILKLVNKRRKNIFTNAINIWNIGWNVASARRNNTHIWIWRRKATRAVNIDSRITWRRDTARVRLVPRLCRSVDRALLMIRTTDKNQDENLINFRWLCIWRWPSGIDWKFEVNLFARTSHDKTNK